MKKIIKDLSPTELTKEKAKEFTPKKVAKVIKKSKKEDALGLPVSTFFSTLKALDINQYKRLDRSGDNGLKQLKDLMLLRSTSANYTFNLKEIFDILEFLAIIAELIKSKKMRSEEQKQQAYLFYNMLEKTTSLLGLTIESVDEAQRLSGIDLYRKPINEVVMKAIYEKDYYSISKKSEEYQKYRRKEIRRIKALNLNLEDEFIEISKIKENWDKEKGHIYEDKKKVNKEITEQLLLNKAKIKASAKPDIKHVRL